MYVQYVQSTQQEAGRCINLEEVYGRIPEPGNYVVLQAIQATLVLFSACLQTLCYKQANSLCQE